MIKEGTREGYRDFCSGLERACSAEAREREDVWGGLEQLKSCLRARFDCHLVPLLRAIGLTLNEPNLFVGLEGGGSDYRIIVFVEKKKQVEGEVPHHPWAVCLVTKVVGVSILRYYRRNFPRKDSPF